MDFSLNDEQQATRELARRILGDLATPEHHRELEKAGQWLDERAWKALADAGLCGIAVPEAHGGAGLGFLEVALVCEEVGRTVAKVPYAPTAVAAMTLAAHAPAALAAEWLPRVAAGEAVLTSALAEATGPYGVQVRSSAAGDAATLDGEAAFVPFGLDAAVVLVPAREDGGSLGLYAVATDGAGVTRTRQDTTTGIPEARFTFSQAPVLGRVGGDDAVHHLVTRATAALCATAVGVCDAALRITADYTKGREQFGRPIATFQAVGHRAADAYIDTEAVRLTALQAAWRIDEGLPADDAVAIAKFWAADGGQRVVHAAQHLHGGMGVDRDYPVHRYFLWAKSIELSLGGATSQLLAFGERLADTPA